MKGVIMAGGSGTRLRPLTVSLPKPMIPFFGRPVMEYAVKLLKAHGIFEIATTLQYHPDKIINYFEDGQKWGVRIQHFVEDRPLGTAGSVRNAKKFLDETFVVLSGDGITNADLTRAIEFHKQKRSKVTIVLKEVEIPIEYGIVLTDEEGRIQRFFEKPSWSEVFSNLANTGIYIIEPEILDYIEDGRPFDFSKDLFPKLLKENVPMFGFRMDGYWCDIGDVGSYIKAHRDVFRLGGILDLDLKSPRISKESNISPNAKISQSVFIGSECEIEDDVEIGEFCVIGDGVKIAKGSKLERAILWNGSFIGKNCELKGCVICSRSILKDYVRVSEKAVVGEKNLLKDFVEVKAEAKIWPEKTIESGTVIDENIYWGTEVIKSVFWVRGITGDFNQEITPQFAIKLGNSIGSVFDKNARILIGDDYTEKSSVIRKAIETGCQVTGTRLYRTRGIILPIFRYIVKDYYDAGIYVRSRGNSIRIEIFDQNGMNIDKSLERKIENLFVTCDFRTSSNINFVNELISSPLEMYFARLEETFESSKFKGLKVCIVSEDKSIISLFDKISERYGLKTTLISGGSKQCIENLKNMCVQNEYDAGFLIDRQGEHFIMMLGDCTVYGEKLKMLLAWLEMKKFKNDHMILPEFFKAFINDVDRLLDVPVKYTGNEIRDYMKAVLEQGINYFFYYDAVSSIVLILERLSEVKDLIDKVKKLEEVHV
ncbi:Nucleotidyl transferase [Caldicellulosiruptor obsidiansis OB47]|uniref:Nucleotidyl transferase n=1 Tax=Caldicellulosiruptor obsidiansis (strain ATCC BAA-2073 / JCM 16842 / OB47) TaxID=608506 RepID=D9THV3_CALOO|nr:sugar phosphate nucleotidyltransferase [Caldicellulosiruptor obsidiansis]ADL41585.1 Nucleotidyl transferase [Caldicellulosiruptor obsidiansis OB47]